MEFRGSIEAIPADVGDRMRGVSWHPTLPGGFVPPALSELRFLRLRHRTFDAGVSEGVMIVAADVAHTVLDVFGELFHAGFPIAKMRLVDDYAASDDRSMADNNTSAYNCRLIAGSTRPSKHALGTAVDINPVQNPYVVRGQVYPELGRHYLDRAHRRPGMLLDGDPAVTAFTRRGWVWGGHWDEPKDFHHFELAPSRRA